MHATVAIVALVVALAYSPANVAGFYLPSASPNDFSVGDELTVQVVKLTSRKTQLPYEYYSLPYCQPEDIKRHGENLGEVLRGDRIMTTLYKVQVGKDLDCASLCERPFDAHEVSLFADRIQEDYRTHMMLDNLPVALVVMSTKTKKFKYSQGFPVGRWDVKTGRIVLFNHLRFKIKYNIGKSGKSRIVGFEVQPQTWDYNTITSSKGEALFSTGASSDKIVRCSKGSEQSPQELTSTGGGQSLRFSYEVVWEKSDVEWNKRWDPYLHSSESQYHWYSIINSLIVVFILTFVVALIMVGSLRRDIAGYNSEEFLDDDTYEETGWKLVYGDVFRPPQHSTLFAAIIGSGIQILLMLLVVLFCAAMGMLSPASRGSLVSVAVALFVLMGVFAGYFSARVYRTIKGQHWTRAAALTSTLFPGTVFTVVFIVNFFVWGAQSSGAIPITTLIALLFMWFGASGPLTFCGYYFGFRKGPFDTPCRTNQIPRQVPEQAWFMHPLSAMMLAGILPFGSVFVELFYIFSALWDGKEYYLFGFLSLVFLIVVVTIAENCVTMCYFYLTNEDYHWWWKSMIMGGGCAIYVFLFSIFYFVSRLQITSFVSTVLYFSYVFLISVSFWFLAATIGFFASFFFVRIIYSSVKVD